MKNEMSKRELVEKINKNFSQHPLIFISNREYFSGLIRCHVSPSVFIHFAYIMTKSIIYTFRIHYDEP